MTATLCGIGEVRAFEAQRANAAHRIGQLFGRHVAGEIAPVQARVRERLFHHVLCRIAGNGMAEAANDFLRRLGHERNA